MKRILIALALSLFVDVAGAGATPITVQFAGTVDSIVEDSATFWPVGTVVAGTVSFNVWPGPYLGAVTDNGAGTVDWSIGANDYSLAMSFIVTAIPVGLESFVISLAAVEPSLPQIAQLLLQFHVGPWNFGDDLHDLLAAGSVVAVGLGVNGPTGYYFAPALAGRDLMATINPVAVPEPATLTTLALGLIGAARYRRRMSGRTGARS
jgi:hypothetical protein